VTAIPALDLCQNPSRLVQYGDFWEQIPRNILQPCSAIKGSIDSSGAIRIDADRRGFYLHPAN
jgi:hypothetical protein